MHSDHDENCIACEKTGEFVGGSLAKLSRIYNELQIVHDYDSDEAVSIGVNMLLLLVAEYTHLVIKEEAFDEFIDGFCKQLKVSIDDLKTVDRSQLN